MTDTAKFVQGSLMRHIIVMASTSAFGLMSIFMVDLLDMWFISLLGDVPVDDVELLSVGL